MIELGTMVAWYSSRRRFQGEVIGVILPVSGQGELMLEVDTGFKCPRLVAAACVTVVDIGG